MKKTGLLKGNEVLKLHTKESAPKLHTKENKFTVLATSNLTEVLDDEKACKKAAELCAKKLEKLFLRLEKQYPWQEILDVYDDPQWIKIINELLKMENKQIDKKQLFEYLIMKLGNLWYESKRAWPGYFMDSPFGARGAWFTMTRKSKTEENNQ